MGLLEGKVAVITGSTRGLGRGIAEAFTREGASVVIAGRTTAAVEHALEILRQQGREHVSGLATDVASLEQAKALAEHALRTFGRIDIWINNAGMSATYGPTIAIDPVTFENVLQTNIIGTYHGSLVALHYFKKQGVQGKLINLMGAGDRKPIANQNAYASSKTWVRTFTLALAKEMQGTGISVHAINPGLVNTDLIRKVDAIKGYEKSFKAFSVIIRLWANPPAVPAQRIVQLASSATDGKSGLEVHVLGLQQQLRGALKELRRIVTRQPAPDTSIDITLVPPFDLFHADSQR